MTKETKQRVLRCMGASRYFQCELARKRSEVPTMMLLGLRQENAPLAFCHALFERGGEKLLLNTLKSGDHRSQYTIAACVDKLIGGREARLDYARNYFCRATGSNKGFDGNVHWGYMKYRILDFFSSDMFGTPGIAAGFAYGIRLNEWDSGLKAEERPIGFAFFGDGAMQQGLFQEVLNGVAARNAPRLSEDVEKVKTFLDELSLEAGVFGGIPMVFVINDNEIACTVNPYDEHGNSDLAYRALGYGNTLGIDVDADDFPSMRLAALQAIAEAQHLRAVLIRARTFRGTAHNHDFTVYEEGALDRGDFSAVKQLIGHDESYLSLFKQKWKEDPLLVYTHDIARSGTVTEKEAREILDEETAEAKEIIERALSEPKVTVGGAEKDRSLFKPFVWDGLPLEAPSFISETRRLGYIEAFRAVVREALREGAIYAGEDVYFGGVLGLTKGLKEEFGPMQLINMPISEKWITNFALGLGLYGTVAFCEFQFAHFIFDALCTFRIIAPQWFQKKLPFGCIAVAPFGPVNRDIRSGEYHESDIARYIQPLAGVAVFAPSNAYDLVGLVRAAQVWGGPSVCLYQISAGKETKEFSSDVPVEPFVIPLGKAKVVREGKDVTVVTYGAACVSAASFEAERLAQEGVGVELVDLRTVYPADFETIVASVKKTHRLIVMHEDFGIGGVGGYIVSELMKEHPELMEKVAVRFLTAAYPFIPTSPELAADRLPYVRNPENEYRHSSPKLASLIQSLLPHPSAHSHTEAGATLPVGEEVLPTSTLQKVAAHRFERSSREIPQVSDGVSIRCSRLLEFLEYQSVRLDHIFLFLAAKLLKKEEFKKLNGYWDREREALVVCDSVNLGFGLNTNRGLVVPVIHKAQTLSFAEFVDRFEDVIARSARNKLRLSDFFDLTFTINNSGRLGGVNPRPLVPYAVRSDGTERPTGVIVNLGRIEGGTMNLVASFDHRGFETPMVMSFLNEIKKWIEGRVHVHEFNVLFEKDFTM